MLLTLIHTHRFPGEAELAGSHLDFLSRLCILSGWIKSFYVLLNTIPMHLSQMYSLSEYFGLHLPGCGWPSCIISFHI